MSNFSFKFKTSFVFKSSFSCFLQLFHCWGKVIIFKKFSDNNTELFFLSITALFSPFIDQSVFHFYKVIFKGDVSIFTHVQSYYKTFNLIVLCLEILECDCIKSFKDFEIILIKLDYSLQWRPGIFFEDFMFAISCKRACDRHIDWWVSTISTPWRWADDVADSLIELMV